MDRYFLLQGIFPTRGLNPPSPELLGGFCTAEPPGKPQHWAVSSGYLANKWMNLHHALESTEHVHKHLLHRVSWRLFELSRQWNSLERLSDLPYSQVVSSFRISFKIFWLLDRSFFQGTMPRVWSEPAFSAQTSQWPQQCFMAKQSITEHWTAKPCQHFSRTHHVYKGKSLSPMLKDRYRSEERRVGKEC